ncbi:uncharacterized protein LOC125565515 [Nematostella vectensis]|uniref:uncharacterized protein LOC125565515 n=1 Tax=Nematostella vectensis TaxID=45351 RepID=UPI0020778A7F|nr:uncharacterized protein LOC125565515 [Nematostella vectensis]
MEILQERRYIDRSTSNSQLDHAAHNKLPYHDGSDWFIGYRPVCNTSYDVSLLGEAVRRAQGLAPARLQFNGEKLTRLLQVYEETCRPSKARVRMLASELQTTEKRITQWFINRRNRFKKMEENWDELSGSVQQKRKR